MALNRECVLTELFKVTQSGNAAHFKAFVEIHFNLDDYWGHARHLKSGNTVACVAAEFGHVSILSLCRDVDLEATNKDGKRPLHIAAQAGHVECVEYLVSRHVDVDCLKLADWTPLMLACTKNCLKVIQRLVDAGANPMLFNKDGWNCFHIAAREGHDDIIRYLLEITPEVCKTVSRNGRMPLHTASLHGKLGVVHTLLTRCCCEPDVRDGCGTTPLMDALRAGHVSVGRVLLRYGANLQSRDNVGKTSLHLAAQADSISSISYLLLECGVDVNERTTNTNDTSLHVAAKEGHVEAINLLLSLKADRSLLNSKSRTALDVAAAGGHLQCVLLLSSYSLADDTVLSNT